MFRMYDEYDDIFGSSRRRGGFSMGLDDVDRRGFAPVSQRAIGEFERARSIFLKHIASVDTSNGPVTTEIINFHLVGDMKTKFNKLVREHGCVPSQRKLSREEQDKINKTRKSLMQFTSVKVTPEAQKAYLEKHPSANTNASTSSSTNASTPLQNSNGKRTKPEDDAPLVPTTKKVKTK